MNIQNFIYLIEVADTGSITKAAQKLYMSQPYLSRIIKEIEEHFKINIFVRTSKGVILTSEGTKFIKQTKLLLKEYNKFKNIKNRSNRDKKTFSITTVRSSLVVESFARLTREYKDYDIEFSIKESGGMKPFKDIYLLNADLGVIYTRISKKDNLLDNLKRKRISYKKINNLSTCIILRNGHPLLQDDGNIDIDNLKHYGLIKYDNAVLTDDEPIENESIYETLIETAHIKNVININNRALLHNLLTQTNLYSIGTTAAKNQEDLFGIVSIPLSSLNLEDQIEMGVISLKNIPRNPISDRFIEILFDTYG